MSSVFTETIGGNRPGWTVWEDERAVAILSGSPLGPGHTLVAPRDEIAHWIDADEGLLTHLIGVAHVIGNALRMVWGPTRVGLAIAGFEVAYLQVHVFPAWNLDGFNFANSAETVEDAVLERHADAVRHALVLAGHSFAAPTAESAMDKELDIGDGE